MKIINKIKKATQDILDTLPNWKNKVYMLELYSYGDKHLEIMYDTHCHEIKQIYENNKGIYIQGRVTSNEGIIYLNDFENFELSKKDKEKRKLFLEKEKKKYDTRISSNLIIPGIIAREYSDKEYKYIWVYLGQILVAERKENVYFEVDNTKVKSFSLENALTIIMDKTNVFFRWRPAKIRFDQIIGVVNEKTLNMLKERYIKGGYPFYQPEFI